MRVRLALYMIVGYLLFGTIAATNCTQYDNNCTDCVAQLECGYCPDLGCFAGNTSQPFGGECTESVWRYIRCGDVDPCLSQLNCLECVSLEESYNCGWCDSFCIAGGANASKPTGLTCTAWATNDKQCSTNCGAQDNCMDCLAHDCGWCDSTSTSPSCMDGSEAGPTTGTCAAPEWRFGNTSQCHNPSHCTKITSCGDCVKDTDCGWCDSTRMTSSCMNDTELDMCDGGAYHNECPKGTDCGAIEGCETCLHHQCYFCQGRCVGNPKGLDCVSVCVDKPIVTDDVTINSTFRLSPVTIILLLLCFALVFFAVCAYATMILALAIRRGVIPIPSRKSTTL